MKFFTFGICLCSLMASSANAQNIGIGTTTPAARLHVADSSVVFTGINDNILYPAIPPPVQGPGIRMLWYPEKAAFRAGFAGFNTWDRDNIGTHSFAGGQGTLAKGRSTTAFGIVAEAIGDYSTATGIYTRTRALGSIVMGAYNNIADNPNPNAMMPEDRILQVGNGSGEEQRSNALTVLRNGNMGIGTTTPNARLQFPNDINQRKLVLYETGNNDHQFYGFGVTSSVLRYQTATTGDDHVFYAGTSTTTSQELMRLRGVGYLGIGNYPEFRLDVSGRMRVRSGGDANNSAGIVFNNNNNSALQSFLGARADDEFGVYGYTGTAGWRFYVNTTSGNAFLQGSLTQNSDARLKKDIEPLSNTLEALEQINGYTYNWKDLSNPDEQIGLLAQEIQKVYPQLVRENDQGTLSVNYSGMVPVLLEAIKEQQSQITELKKLITQLIKQSK